MTLKLWEKFTHWVVKDFYTLEERALVLVEAERLKMKTDLQAERIAKRRAKEKEREERNEYNRNTFVTIAVWRLNCTVNGKKCVQQFYLEETPEPFDGDSYRRRVKGGPTTEQHTGKVIYESSAIGAFQESQETYIKYIIPWYQWTLKTKDLEKSNFITVIAKGKD